MKIYTRKMWNKIKYILFNFLIISMSFGVLGILVFFSFSSNQKTSQPTTKKLEIQENKYKTLGEINSGKEAAVQESVLIEQPIEVANFNDTMQIEPVNIISEAEQKEIDRMEAQIKELDRIKNNSKSNYQPTKPIDFALPELEPITATEIDTTIKVQPIDGTIKPTNRPADVCASSAAKFLPECK